MLRPFHSMLFAPRRGGAGAGDSGCDGLRAAPQSSPMDSWTVLGDILLLLIGGFLLGALAERMRQSAILGYLVAGMLLGPNALRWVETREQVSLLAELGVALLLFSIGLEFSWSRLRRTGAAGLGGGTLQVVVTVLAGAGVLALFGMENKTAIAMGAILALSSTAYVLRVLANRAEIDSLHGRTAVGVLLAQDVALVPLVMLISVMGGGGSGGEILLELAKLLGFALLLVLAIWVLFTHLVPRLLGAEVLRRNRELPLLLAVASAIGSALGAHSLGLSPALGAFLTGMMLAETPFATQVRADISALRTVLLVLFFGSIGMLGDASWIAAHLPVVLLAVAGAVIGKGLFVTAALRTVRVPWPTALAAGIALAQIGEFSFVLAELSREGLLGDDLFQLVVSVTIVTLALTPYLVAGAPRLASWLTRRLGETAPSGEATGDESSGGHVLVIGFGPTGQAVAAALADCMNEVEVIDLNPSLLAEARQRGHRTHLGDATHPEVLEHAAVARALAIAVTLPDPRSARRVIEQARALAPGARVFARARYHVHGASLHEAGAHAVVDEEEQVGRALAAVLVEELQRTTCGMSGAGGTDGTGEETAE